MQIEWDMFESCVAADGTPLIRHAISDRDGVRFEISMFDEVITELVPRSEIFTAKGFPNNAARIIPEPSGGFTALLKVGDLGDKTGNLLFFRITVTGRPLTVAAMERYVRLLGIVLSALASFGIKLDKHVMETIKRN